jgi:hypothetical protein
MHRAFALLVATLVIGSPAAVGGNGARDALIRSWEGRPVILRQPLYTLIYNERGKLGTTHNGRRDGLTVLTPSNGVYFQFDGRQGKDDITSPAAQPIMVAVNEAYGPDALDLRSYRKLEAVAVHQFSVGVRLVIGKIRIERDSVKVPLMQPGAEGDADAVTSITIKWPLPFSKSFTEGDNIDALLRTYVDLESTF